MSNPMPQFDQVYAGQALGEGVEHIPWNIGEPQPPIAALIEAGDVHGEVLDAGCGVGETSLFLAARGFRTVGVDASTHAIDQASRAARARQLPPQFQVADVTELHGFDARFDTIIDSTLFHSLPVEDRPAYVSSLACAAAPGAVWHALVFSRAAPFPAGVGPNTVDEDELRDAVGTHWLVDRVSPARITAIMPESDVYDAEQVERIERDERGRGLLPAYLLTAHLPQ